MKEGRKIILVIDDEAGVVDIIARALLRNGYDVIRAHSGEEGLDKLRVSSPHLILLDVNMPKMSGIEFYRHICNADNQPAFPVLVITALSHLAELFREMCVDGFIAKPCKTTDILNEIGIIIRKRYPFLEPAAAPEVEKLAKKVIIIGDNSGYLEKLSAKFAAAGYSVAAARSGKEGVEEIMTKELPDFIVLNLILPDISGDSIAYRLRHMPKTMDIPIVFYTLNCPTLDHIVTRKVCERVGVKNLVESPDPQEVLNEVERIRKDKLTKEK